MQGVEMYIRDCHPDDVNFVKGKIAELPPCWRDKVLEFYQERFRDNTNQGLNEQKRSNVARRAANQWLLKYVKDYKKHKEAGRAV